MTRKETSKKSLCTHVSIDDVWTETSNVEPHYFSSIHSSTCYVILKCSSVSSILPPTIVDPRHCSFMLRRARHLPTSSIRDTRCFMLRSAHHLPTIAHRIISLETLHGLTRMPSSNLSTVKPDLFPADPACAAKRNFFPLFCSDSFLIKSPHTNTHLNQCNRFRASLSRIPMRGYH